MRTTRAMESWTLALNVERKADRTIDTYCLAVEQLNKFLDDPEVGEITRDDIREFLLDFQQTRSGTTALQRYRSLNVFFQFLVDEEEISSNPLDRLKPPQAEEKPIKVIPKEVFQEFLDTCDGTFKGRRDRAILWMLWDSGVRLGEITGIKMGDFSTMERFVRVAGKTGHRIARFTANTSHALDRYLRVRDDHRLAHLDDLWLGERGPLTHRGISQMITKKATANDLPHVHAHQFRHSATHRFLSAGMNEGDVMAVMGWSPGSRSMLDRYGADERDRRAFDSYSRLIG